MEPGLLLRDERLDRLWNASPSSIPSSTSVAAAVAASTDHRCRRLPFSDLARHSFGDAALVVLVQSATPPQVFSDWSTTWG